MAEVKLTLESGEYCTHNRAGHITGEFFCKNGLETLFAIGNAKDIYAIVTKRPQNDNDYRIQVSLTEYYVRVMTKRDGWVKHELHPEVCDWFSQVLKKISVQDGREEGDFVWDREGFIGIELPE